jgi:hypothetical protein
LSQIFFSTLVHRVHDYQVVAKNGSGGGVLTALIGVKALAGLWVIAILSALATILLGVSLRSQRRERKAHFENGNSTDKDARLKDYQLSSTASSSKTPGIAVRGASPFPGIIRRATNKMFGTVGIGRYDDTSYETLRVAGGEPRGRSRSPAARSRDPSRSRAGTLDEKGGSGDGSGAEEGEGRTGARYEPYRHQSGP